MPWKGLGFHIPSLIIYLVNFGILLGLLYLFAYKPILRMMDQRADRIRESLEAADTARQEAARSQADTQAQLNEARPSGATPFGPGPGDGRAVQGR